MSDKRLTIWEQARLSGYSRRDFVQFCRWMAAAAGIEHGALGAVVKAMETKPPPARRLVPLPGMHLLQRVVHPVVSPDRGATSSWTRSRSTTPRRCRPRPAHQAEEALHDTMKKYKGQYLMLVEGSVPTADGGVYCCIAGRTALDIVKEAAADAKAIVAWGKLRVERLHPGRQPEPDERHAGPRDHHRASRSSTSPAARRSPR